MSMPSSWFLFTRGRVHWALFPVHCLHGFPLPPDSRLSYLNQCRWHLSNEYRQTCRSLMADANAELDRSSGYHIRIWDDGDTRDWLID
jgi:hypothetical protein